MSDGSQPVSPTDATPRPRPRRTALRARLLPVDRTTLRLTCYRSGSARAGPCGRVATHRRPGVTAGPAGALLRRSTRYRRAPRCARLGGSPESTGPRRARPWRPRRPVRGSSHGPPEPAARLPGRGVVRAAAPGRRGRVGRRAGRRLGRSRPAVRPWPAGQAAARLGPRVGGRVPGLPSGRALLHGVRHAGRPARRDRAGAGSAPASAPPASPGPSSTRACCTRYGPAARTTVRLVPRRPGRPGRRRRLRRCRGASPGSRWRACRSANHEVGTTQPVDEVAACCRAAGVPLLVDAAAVRRPRTGARRLGRSLAASAHKWGGPAGVGVLAVRTGVRWRSPLPADDRTTTRGYPASRTSPAPWRRPRRSRR